MSGAQGPRRWEQSNRRLRRCAKCDAPIELATLYHSGQPVELEPRYLGAAGGNLEPVLETDDGDLVVRLVPDAHRWEIGAAGRARLRAPHRRTCPCPNRETNL